MSAQARLYMPHGNLQVEASESRRKARSRVAVHEDHVRPLFLENRLQLQQHIARDIEQRLPRLHDCQVMVGNHIENTQNLIEHLAMLTRHGHNRLKLVGRLLSSFTSGHILMASGRVPKTSITFFKPASPCISLMNYSL